MKFAKSLDNRARECFAQGCNTYSKRSDQFMKGVYPTHFIEKGKRSYEIICNDGKTYIDWIGGLGSSILYPDNNYCLPTEKEVILAEMIKKRIPFIDKMRFLKTGSEACQAAVRIARAANPCDPRVGSAGIGIGYHGWHNWSIASEDPGKGCINEQYTKFDSLDNMIEYLNGDGRYYQISYCIIEPVMLDLDVKSKLLKLKNICNNKHGGYLDKIVLIFDEVITGFRTPGYCMANYLGIEPDIICLGKAVANGAPLAIVGGKKEFMDTPDYFISSTFAGEEFSIDRAISTLKTLTPRTLELLWKRGAEFQKAFNAISPAIWMHGIPTKAVFETKDEMTKWLFWQEMNKRGYMMGKAWHIMLCHTPDVIKKTLKDCQEVIMNIEKGKYKLEGEPPKEVFKRY